MDQPWPLFVYFCSFQAQFYRKNVDFSGIRTRIVGVEGEYADHLTTTTAQHWQVLFNIKIRRPHIRLFAMAGQDSNNRPRFVVDDSNLICNLNPPSCFKSNKD